MSEVNIQQPPQQAPKKSHGWMWFWGIFISLTLVALIFVGIAFMMFSHSLSRGLDMDDGNYYYESTGRGNGKIAIVELNYTIYSAAPIVRQFKKYADDESIKAIVLRVNSPGGGVAASQEMYEIIKRTRDGGKPVIVSFGSIAASGGYYAACGGSIIVSNPGSLTGSIGVIASFLSVKDLAEKLGIDETVIKSGELKDAGNPFREPNEKDLAYFQDIVDNSFEQFFEVVATERNMDRDKLREIANGRVFTGLQAQELGLVDSIGTYEDAIRIAADMVGIEGDPVIVQEKRRLGLWGTLLDGKSDIKEIKDEFRQEFMDAPILQYKYVK